MEYREKLGSPWITRKKMDSPMDMHTLPFLEKF